MRFVNVFLGLCAAVIFTSHGSAAEAPLKRVNVADFITPASPTGGIQEAMDALGGNGGTVTIPPGEYLLRRSIRIYSHVTLQGAGEKTILRKVKQTGSRLAAPADAESRSVSVVDATGWRAGDAIGIFDRKTVGWLHVPTIIKEVRGNELLLERRIGRAFDPAQSGSVINYFSAISGSQVTGVVIKDLVIDGRREENPGVDTVLRRGLELGFNFAAINLVDVTDSRIENCRIQGWPSDGISLQRGGGNVVTRCVVEHCRGEGYHPGGGLHDSVFSNNAARRNLASGFFFCARVQRVTVKNSQFLNNGRNGVGDLGHSGDTGNIVEENLCEGNALNGIEMLDGEANTVRNNICRNNSRSAAGRCSGILLAATARSVVSGNQCHDDQPIRTQKYGIEELADCRENMIDKNECGENLREGLALAGQDHR